MKRTVILFLVLFIALSIGFLWFGSEPKIADGTKATARAVVTDRAMSNNMPYISVEFPDGIGLCFWDPEGNVIPDGISIGDQVEVTYGKQDGFDRYVILNVSK